MINNSLNFKSNKTAKENTNKIFDELGTFKGVFFVEKVLIFKYPSKWSFQFLVFNTLYIFIFAGLQIKKNPEIAIKVYPSN